MGGIPRRQVLAAMLAAPAALSVGGCALLRDDRPDPLVPLAAQARSDAALAAAVVEADGVLAARVEPVRAARSAHAAALEVEIARRDLDPTRRPAADVADPSTTPAPSLAVLHRAMTASGETATELALRLPADRAGLVASVAACCAAYAELLT